MNLRAPSIPLITVDPYFSYWMPADKLYESEVNHWTGKDAIMNGYVIIDNEKFRFLGDNRDFPVIPQKNIDISALVTDFEFENEKINLKLSFFTPLLPDDLYHISRPVSYLNISYESVDGKNHDVSIEINASEEYCINKKGEKEVEVTDFAAGTLKGKKIGTKDQKILNACGDDIRIDWGYFYLCGPEGADSFNFFDEDDKINFIGTSFKLSSGKKSTVLFAYDDIYSIEYFGKQTPAYWKSNGEAIEQAIENAYKETDEIKKKSEEFSAKLFDDALKAGGREYAELLSLAYRQVIAAHKLILDEEGKVIFISKECFSNGCAATVDVTYPSSPMLLLYNIELLKGTLRPIYKFARSEYWNFDFAPHDAGCYPFIDYQRYGLMDGMKYRFESQMPVEECGNMLIMVANISLLEGNTKYFDENADINKQWVKYLCEYGNDPENQLCTDDFAGHLAHNCNLSLKAIMGIKGYSMIMEMKGEKAESEKYSAIASEMADSWIKRAWNPEKGGFRLAFDKPETFSMKYNMVWDKFWKTNLFPEYVKFAELVSNRSHFHIYGMPLDNRKNYTKSDWTVWTACMTQNKEDFESYIKPMYDGYNVSLSRVPLTDWYDTDTASVIGFRHRSVQGGLFLKLLEDKF